MDFVGGLPMSRRGHDYLYVVVDRFSKMCILMPWKKQVTTEQAASLFCQHVWVHFGLPTSIILVQDYRFLGEFWTKLWCMMDTKLKRSTAFHPHTDGQTDVVNRIVVHLLRGYCNKQPKLWDEQIQYVQHATTGLCILPLRARHLRHALGTCQRLHWTWIMGERLSQALPRMNTKPASSFREVNMYIKQCKSSWRRVKPSTRLAMTSIELIISLR